ncbi:MAG TPA: hypothetical protein VNA24_08840 [Hyalangium sp.]|nr:hypothetical protein [Hyalangium sp.]
MSYRGLNVFDRGSGPPVLKGGGRSPLAATDSGPAGGVTGANLFGIERALVIAQLQQYGVSIEPSSVASTSPDYREFSTAELKTLLQSVRATAASLNELPPAVSSGSSERFKQLFGDLVIMRVDDTTLGDAMNYGNKDPRGGAAGGKTYIELGDGVFDTPEESNGTIRSGDSLTPMDIITHELAHTLNYRFMVNPDGQGAFTDLTSAFIAELKVSTRNGLGFIAGLKDDGSYQYYEALADAIANWTLDAFSSPADPNIATTRTQQMDGLMLLLLQGDESTVQQQY